MRDDVLVSEVDQVFAYAVLDMRYPSLARAELSALLTVEGVEWRLDEILHPVLIARVDPFVFANALSRSSLIREAGVLNAIYDSCNNRLLFHDPYSMTDKPVWVVYRKHRLAEGGFDQADAVRLVSRLGARLGRTGVRVHVHHVLCSVYVGLPLYVRDSKGFEARRPRMRPVFRPGTLDAYVSRAFVNLSMPPRNGILLDPFCGVGGFCIEALLSGVGRVFCGDISFLSVDGARVNLSYYGSPGLWNIFKGDATNMPLASNSVDSIATDPPYGRSSSTKGRDLEELLWGFLGEAYRVIRKGGGISFAGPAGEWLVNLALESGFRVWWYGEMHVHGGLVRGVVAARKV